MSFNLDAAFGFQGLDADRPIHVYTRNLPHWRQDGATYFVTFNLRDALPTARKALLKSMRREWEARHPTHRSQQAWSEWAKQCFRSAEKWMDEGYGACWFRMPQYSRELRRSILHFHGQRYEVGCFAILGNHCHLVIRPFKPFQLEDEIGAIKSVSSQFVNKRESLTGALWQQEFYDRIIRDEEHLYRVVQYIGANPKRAGIPQDQWSRWINPDWEAQGWGFVDD